MESQEATHNIMAIVSERVRRQDHISLIPDDHIFKGVVLDCLNDDEKDRPSSQELCHQLTLLKEWPVYMESKELNTDQNQSEVERDMQREADRNTIQRLEREFNTSRVQCQQLREELDSMRGSYRREITLKNNQLQQQHSRIASLEQQRHQKVQECEQKDIELQRVKSNCDYLQSQLDVSEEAVLLRDIEIEALGKKINELHQELYLKTSLLEQFQHKTEELAHIELQWRKGNDACIELRREPDAVINGNTIFFKYFWGKSIFSYNTDHQSWTEFPGCPVSSFSMAVLDNLLTVIGGKNADYAPVATLYSYSGKKWVQLFPRMKVERYWTISNTCDSFLIVMGGEGSNRQVLNTVEVLDIGTQQWSFASSLPRPMDSATSAICGDHLYIGGGSQPETARYATVCSLPELIHGQKRVWNIIDDLPYLKTSLISVDNYLLAVGGKDELNQPTSAVYAFNGLGKKWEKVSEMTTARSSCFAVTLPNNEIMVVGGINEDVDVRKSVEFACLKHN